MGETLLMADSKNAYTLSDMGTYLTYQKRIKLKALFSEDPFLRNQYSVIALNPDRFRRQTIARQWISSGLSLLRKGSALSGTTKNTGSVCSIPMPYRPHKKPNTKQEVFG